MSGYPPNYGYGAPGAQPPYGAGAPYGDKPHKAEKPYKDQAAPGAYAPYGAPYGGAPPYGAPPTGDKPYKPPKDHHSGSGSYDPYGGAPPYGAPPTGDKPYKPPKDHHSGSGSYDPYGGAPPYGAPPTGDKPYKPPKDQHSGSGSYDPYGAPQSHGGGYPPAPGAYGNPFAALTPSQFPPGTDPSIISGFTMADQDRSGFIDDKELQRALSGYSQSFSLRTVHLLMYLFTNTNTRKIGPKEFTAVYYSLQNWRGIFERYDRDRSGKIDSNELREALLSLGFSVSPVVLDLLISKFDKSGGKNRAIEYDNFIECCLTVKGLTEKFKEKDTTYSGSASFTYEGFMLTVLPFLIA